MATAHLNHSDIGGKCFSVTTSHDLAREDKASKHPKSFFAFSWLKLKTCSLREI